jgi:hypothetical protein
MIRKLILATAAVMALSTGAQADNVSAIVQSGNSNDSNVLQTGPVATSNTSALVQLGFFNNGSVGQTGGNNTSATVQAGGNIFTGPTFDAARNTLAVGQNGINSSGTNFQTSLQLNSNATAASFGSTPLNAAAVTQINANVNSADTEMHTQ